VLWLTKSSHGESIQLEGGKSSRKVADKESWGDCGWVLNLQCEYC
jgi:hypothetical protein